MKVEDGVREEWLQEAGVCILLRNRTEGTGENRARQRGEVMEVKGVPGGTIEYIEERYMLRVHKYGSMYVRHNCGLNYIGDCPLTFGEVLNRRCKKCGPLEIPESLCTLWTLYNFDRIQRGE